MCHINVVYRKDKTNDRTMNHIMNIMSHDSFKVNSHGQGILFFKKDTKNKEQVVWKLDKTTGELLTMENAFLLMSHQRWATSGKGDPWVNTQPLETNDFIIMHNGVLGSMGSEKKSDTHELILQIQQRYENQETKDEIAIIKAMFPTIMGSYSIILYNKDLDRLIYFKNAATSFYYTHNKDFFVASTSKINVEYAQSALSIKREAIEPQAGTIYDLYNDFEVLDSFEPYVWKQEVYPVRHSHSTTQQLWGETYKQQAIAHKPENFKKEFANLKDKLNKQNPLSELEEGVKMSPDTEDWKDVAKFLDLQFNARLFSVNGERVSMGIKKRDLEELSETLSFVHVTDVYSNGCHVIVSLQELDLMLHEFSDISGVSVTSLDSYGDLRED